MVEVNGYKNTKTRTCSAKKHDTASRAAAFRREKDTRASDGPFPACTGGREAGRRHNKAFPRRATRRWGRPPRRKRGGVKGKRDSFGVLEDKRLVKRDFPFNILMKSNWHFVVLVLFLINVLFTKRKELDSGTLLTKV